MNASTGGTVGGYRLVAPIRADALGQVFIADHSAPPRREVLRILAIDTRTPEAPSQFAHRARAMQGVIHPGLAGVLQFGVDAGRAWLTSRYVDGHLLTGDRRTDAQALAIADLIADALDHAHRRHLVHGDLAPNQILLASDVAAGSPGSAVLLDLGVIGLTGRPTLDPLAGTAIYTAPEVIGGQTAGPASDQYSLACILYQLLTGTAPFIGSSDAEVIDGHLHRPAPPLSTHRPDLAAADRVFGHALDKAPTRRYPDCRSFVASVAAVLGGSGAAAPSVAPEAAPSLRGRGQSSTPAPAPTPEAALVPPPSAPAPRHITEPASTAPGAVSGATITPPTGPAASPPTLVPTDTTPPPPVPSAFTEPPRTPATAPPASEPPPTSASSQALFAAAATPSGTTSPEALPPPADRSPGPERLGHTYPGSAAPTAPNPDAATPTPRRRPRRALAIGLGVLAAVLVAAIAVGATLLVVGDGSGDLTQVTATTLSTGHGTTCTIRDKQAYCWGDAADGKLGTGATSPAMTPVKVEGLTNVTAIAVGWTSVCAVLDGSLYCWGGNADGQLGDGSVTDHPTPTKVRGLTHVTSVTVGSDVSLSGNDIATTSTVCAVADGGAYCWGANTHGQIGNGTTDPSNVPTKVRGISDVTAMTTDSAQTCALTRPGDVYCWGDNRQGQLGDGTMTDQRSPVRIPNVSSATDVATAVGTTCAVSDAALWCWGNNTYGQIGDGTRRLTRVPTQVAGISNVRSVALGGQTICATTDDAPYCWGNNNSNAAVKDPRGYLLTPTKVTGITGTATAVTTAAATTCAATEESVYCWGYNQDGEAGIGSADYIESPTEVAF
ncbi:protein kinase [Gordonia sp. VNQ95]|uniref:protein kinase domain-containing protein n=1 Tax=Gordonia sp. VNQ95 TaxID=3156619 RepID=UPI0032B51E02